MGALVTVHNDGPDMAEIRIGRRSIVLQPGGDLRFSLSVPIVFGALAQLDANELAMHMGQSSAAKDPLRYVTEDD
jgi:hypothetical protein